MTEIQGALLVACAAFSAAMLGFIMHSAVRISEQMGNAAKRDKLLSHSMDLAWKYMEKYDAALDEIAKLKAEKEQCECNAKYRGGSPASIA